MRKEIQEYAVWKLTLGTNHYISLAPTTPHLSLRIIQQTACFWIKLQNYWTSLITVYNNLIIMGYFNMHIHGIPNLENLIFNDTMEALGLSQEERTPTYKQGNTLDLIYIEDNSQLKYRNCQTHGFISDHAIVTVDMYLLKPKPTTKKICNNKIATKEALIQNFEPPTID